MRPELPLETRRGPLAVDQRTILVGILNITPDSFSDGGQYLSPGSSVKRALQMIAEGVDVIDVGGESTRPGAEPVSEEIEKERVVPVIREIRAAGVRIPISIDTTKSTVAEAALAAGADIVNDVSAMRADRNMARLVEQAGVPIILMHMLGTPQTMQLSPCYKDVVEEVRSFLADRLHAAQDAGIARSQLIVDPGIGFGKNLSHNLQLLWGLPRLTSLGVPVMVGPSRKSFLGAILGTEVGDRLEGILAAVVLAVLKGASLVRVHDVKEVKRALRVLEMIVSENAQTVPSRGL